MWFGIVSLFPTFFDVLQIGVTGRAIKKNIISLAFFNPRDFTQDRHHTVDDSPYGGGPGMLMKAPPLKAAIEAAKSQSPHSSRVIYLSPQGKRFNQRAAYDMAQDKSIILVSGRYEGIDERIISTEIDEEWSIGDYILTGGELAALIMIDAIARLLPQVLHDQNSVKEDSLTKGLLKYPQFTKPAIWQDLSVPEVLLSGHHQQIEDWRHRASLITTWSKRPDLLKKLNLTEKDILLLLDFLKESADKKNTR